MLLKICKTLFFALLSTILWVGSVILAFFGGRDIPVHHDRQAEREEAGREGRLSASVRRAVMTDDERAENIHNTAKSAADMVDLLEREDVYVALEELASTILKLTRLYHELGVPVENIAGAIGGASASSLIAALQLLA